MTPPTQPTSAERNTALAEERTQLALERSFLAFERTLMAWLRTSLSMIGFGFTLVKFFQYLEGERGGVIVGRFGRTWASDTVGLAMIAIGTVAPVTRCSSTSAVSTRFARRDSRGSGTWRSMSRRSSPSLGVFAFVSLVVG